MGVKTGYWRQCCVLWGAALLLSTVATDAIAATEKVVRSPTRTWHRELSEDQSRLMLVNKTRVAAIDMRIGNRLPDDSDIRKMVERLTGQSEYRVRGRWPQATLTEASVQMGVSIALSDGRKGMYAAIWRRRSDGSIGVASYMAIATSYTDENIADFKLVRSMGNQLARGLVLAPSPQLAPAPVIIAAVPPPPVVTPAPAPALAPVITPPPVAATTAAAVSEAAVLPSVAVPAASAPPIVTPPPVIVTAPAVTVPAPPVPAPVPLPAAVPPPVVVSAPLIVAPAPASVAPPAVPAVVAALPAPAAAAARGYPFVAAAGAGVSLNQISSVLYAPLESSEVFVLFKDGSFHENLPVALEEWNVGASRQGDPSSWGKWKTAPEADEFELAYAADDVVTIAARKIKPAKSGLVLDGSYAIESSVESSAAEEIEFTGNRFEITRQGSASGGSYRVDGYSLIMNYDDGRAEHRPFFVVPPEEEGEDPSIWLGDTLRVRVD